MPKYIQRRISLLFITGFVLMILCDFCYGNNWFGVNDIMTRRQGKDYSIGEMIFGIDNYVLLFFLTWSIKKATPDITWMRYVCALSMDLLFAGICWVIIWNPYIQNWNVCLWMLSGTALFFCKLFLSWVYPNSKNWIIMRL